MIRIFLFFIFIFIISSNLYAKNITKACWHSNSLISSNTKVDGFFNRAIGKKRMTFSVNSLSKNCIRVGEKIYSHTLEKVFRIKTIYREKKSYKVSEQIYKHLYKKNDIKNLKSFKKTFQNFNPLYACYISWLNTNQPEEYISIFPCR